MTLQFTKGCKMATIIIWYSLKEARKEDETLDDYGNSLSLYLFFIAMAELLSACLFHLAIIGIK